MARGQERERESVAVMCNGELYRGRRACEAKRDLNWRWSDMWVSPHIKMAQKLVARIIH